MRRLVSILALAALAACATDDAPVKEARSTQFEAIAAPTPEGVAIKLDADDSGQNATVVKGSKFAVELVGTPTAGLAWVVTEAPAFIAKAGEYGGPTSTAQLQEGFAGGSHWEGFVFDVTGTGEGELHLEQRSALGGADGEPPLAEWSAYLFAKDEE